MKRGARVLLLLVLPACARGDGATGGPAARPTPTAPPAAAAQAPAVTVATLAEAKAAQGKLVRVTGTAQREKLIDSVDTPGLTVLCQGTRLPDDVIGKQVTVEGTLELTSEAEATVNAKGEISQGTEPGASYYVLRACARR